MQPVGLSGLIDRWPAQTLVMSPVSQARARARVSVPSAQVYGAYPCPGVACMPVPGRLCVPGARRVRRAISAPFPDGLLEPTSCWVDAIVCSWQDIEMMDAKNQVRGAEREVEKQVRKIRELEFQLQTLSQQVAKKNEELKECQNKRKMELDSKLAEVQRVAWGGGQGQVWR